MNRREFLQGTAKAGVLLGLGAFGVACAPEETADSAVTTSSLLGSATTAATASPSRGGQLQMAMSVLALYSSLDPAKSGSVFDLTATGALFESLLKTDDQFVVEPWLAESWDKSDDNLVWTFQLREGVQFHDGKDLVADDVVHSLRRILDPDTGSPSQGVMSLSLGPEGIEAVDQRTVRLTLTSPNSFLGQMLASYNFRIVQDGATFEELDRNPIGTGPFQFVEADPAERFIASRNENYWRDGLPYLDGLEILSVPDQTAKVQAVVSGDAHIGDEIQPAQLQQLGDAQTYVGENLGFQVIALHGEDEPFTDERVRRAIKHSVDRQAMVDLILEGNGSVGMDVPVSPNNPLLPSDLEYPEYDPEMARGLLAEAGYSDGLSFELHATENVYMLPTATVYREQAAESGINVEVVQVPSAQWGSTWNAVPAYTSWWVRNPPDIVIHQAAVGDAIWNESQFDDPDFNEAIAASRAAQSPEEQAEAYRNALPILAERSGWVIPFWFDRIFPAKSNLIDVVVDPVQQLDFSAAYLA